MSRDDERVPVPTNGRGPYALPEAGTAVAEEAPAAPEVTAPRLPVVDATPPTVATDELTIAITPRQLAVGFGILAGIVLLLARRRPSRGR